MSQDHIYPIVKLSAQHVALDELILFADKPLDRKAEYCVLYRKKTNCTANVKLLTDTQQNLSAESILLENGFVQVTTIKDIENSYEENLPASVYVKSN